MFTKESSNYLCVKEPGIFFAPGRLVYSNGTLVFGYISKVDFTSSDGRYPAFRIIWQNGVESFVYVHQMIEDIIDEKCVVIFYDHMLTYSEIYELTNKTSFENLPIFYKIKEYVKNSKPLKGN